MMTIKNKNILFITYGGWTHASSRIRALNYIEKLEATDPYKIYWIPRAPEIKKGLLEKITFFFLKRVLYVRQIYFILTHPIDLIFVQRVFLSSFALKLIHFKKIPFIYDFDDAIFLGKTKNYSHTVNMIKKAQKVIVSSPILSSFCLEKGANATIIPSPINENEITTGIKSSEIPTIGWIGSPWTQKYLKNIEKSLEDVSNERQIIISAIGVSPDFDLNNVPLKTDEWALEKENEELQKMDIGIMPLDNDEWSRGKGGYKLYQYMAAGIPIVASPVGINKEIVDHGVTGFLANTHREWVECLLILINNKELRESMGEKGRIKFNNNYSYKVCFPVLNKIIRETIR